jgi:hypothetical protein
MGWKTPAKSQKIFGEAKKNPIVISLLPASGTKPPRSSIHRVNSAILRETAVASFFQGRQNATLEGKA